MAQNDNHQHELLAPAGNPEALAAAVREGADAVYLGLKTFNARLRSANFAFSQFEAAVNALHKAGRKLYAAVNTVWIEREADRMYQLLNYIARTGCDGVIVQDFGTLNFARTYNKDLPVHASTQMNIASSAACNALSKLGVSRVVLARELTFDEIKMIRASTNVELEVFVHGALCVSASGLCLFSSFLGGKSANRGMCTQACRRIYTTDDDNANYFFSPHDLQLIEKIPHLAEAGVTAFKIEGRMKSADYTGAAVAAYRAVLDAVEETHSRNIPLDESEVLRGAMRTARQILENDFARRKTIFHIDGTNPRGFLNPSGDGGTGVKLGVIAKIQNRAGCLCARIDNAETIPAAGDTIRLHRADDSLRVSHKLHVVSADGSSWWCGIPEGFSAGDGVYLIQRKATSKRYAPVLPNDLAPFKKQPGHEHAPLIKLTMPKRCALPEGISVCVANVEDLYTIQTARPARVILNINIAVAKRLSGERNPLPFPPRGITLCFDPFYNEAAAREYAEYIPRLITLGYTQYIINNYGQFALFKNTNTELIAGSYLYSFNRAAIDLILREQVRGIITPLENARQNVERCFEKKERAAAALTVFAYPALFRIQARLNDVYRFRTFAGTHGEEFRMTHGDAQSVVTPAQPFSIIDKIPFLRAAGFKCFIIDLSPHRVQKKIYKDIMRAASSAAPLAGASRFNWKNGFYEAAPATANYGVGGGAVPSV